MHLQTLGEKEIINKYRQLPPQSIPPNISPTTLGALIFSNKVPMP